MSEEKKSREGLSLRAARIILPAAAAFGLWLLAGRGLAALLEAWNVNDRTLSRAPAWAAWIWQNAAPILSWIGALLALAAGLIAANGRGASPRGKRGYAASLLWALPPLAAVVVLLLADSLRLRNGLLVPEGSWLWALRLTTVATAAAAEGVWVIRIVRDGLAGTRLARVSRPLAALLLAALYLALQGLSAAAFASSLLLGWLLSEERRSCVEAALGRFAFLLTGSLIFAPDGRGALYGLIDVSDDWLTGGASGVFHGWLLAIILSGTLIWKYRNRFRFPCGRKREDAGSPGGKSGRA